MKVRDIEDRSRRNNLWLIGYCKNKEKTGMEVRLKLKKTYQLNIRFENAEIEHAHRFDKKERDNLSQERTIIAKYLNYKEKVKVLQEYRSRKLCVERLYINEDFSEETIQIRKKIFKQAKELREKENFGKVIHNRLISVDARQNPAKIDAGNEYAGNQIFSQTRFSVSEKFHEL